MNSTAPSTLCSSLILSGYFWFCILTPQQWHFIDGVNLIFHEAGHAICFFLPALVTAAAGSGLQVAIPLVCAVYFLNRREVVTANTLGLWVAQNVISVSAYMHDAIKMELPLLGGDSSTHDWNFIFGQLEILNWSVTLANLCMYTGYGIAITCSIIIVRFFVQHGKTKF